MEIVVIGAGYVGLVAAAGFASVGHRVVCVDIDQRKVDAINAGRPLLHEAGLADIVQAALAQGTLRVTVDLASCALDAEAIFICVETPSTAADGIDLLAIRECARGLGDALRDRQAYCAVAVKSTVVPGTAEDVVGPAIWTAAGKTREEIGLVSNPEFLREGQAVHDFLHPDRIMIGGIDEASIRVVSATYSPFAAPIFTTTPRTAELVKYASNTLWATLVSFANEIATICEVTPGVDVEDVMEAMHMDDRFASTDAGASGRAGLVSYLRAGCGFGGSCLPKDVRALLKYARDAGAEPDILSAVMRVNESRPRALVQLVERALGTLTDRRLAVLGLSFKPGTDDMRESSAVHVINGFLRHGARVQAYDPVAQGRARATWTDPHVTICSSVEDALDGAEAAILVTAWPEFSTLNWERLRERMAGSLVIDGRRQLDGAALEKAGYQYLCVGRQPDLIPAHHVSPNAL
jgi:UDPglucose 6-dehydrogenase